MPTPCRCAVRRRCDPRASNASAAPSATRAPSCRRSGQPVLRDRCEKMQPQMNTDTHRCGFDTGPEGQISSGVTSRELISNEGWAIGIAQAVCVHLAGHGGDLLGHRLAPRSAAKRLSATTGSRTRRRRMIERREPMAKAAAWMQARGWKGKLAKRRGREQSMFEHTLIEIDVLLHCCRSWPANARTFPQASCSLRDRSTTPSSCRRIPADGRCVLRWTSARDRPSHASSERRDTMSSPCTTRRGARACRRRLEFAGATTNHEHDDARGGSGACVCRLDETPQ